MRVTGVDLFPTIAEMAGVAPLVPQDVEGGSLVPVLRNSGEGTVTRIREEFVFHFPHYDMDSLGPASAIVLGDYKLLRAYEGNRRLLFDLSSDIGERRDLAASMPEKVAELDQRLTEYLSAVHAQMPLVREGDSSGVDREPVRNSGRRRDLILGALDSNGDRDVSADELKQLPKLLKQLDANRDGTISAEEYRTQPAGR